MAGVLLDSNVLIAVLLDGHEHHDAADRWLAEDNQPFATCPITEGSLVREVLRGGDAVRVAVNLLRQVNEHERHEFWSDRISYLDVRFDGVRGHNQVTDAYLAQLARSRRARLATFDSGLADLHADVAELVPTS